jgi:hypothetical protein
MKKLLMMVAAATVMFACGQKQAPTASSTESSADSLGGTTTSLDEKSKAIQLQLDAYIAQDTTYAADVYADNAQIFYPGDTLADLRDKQAFLADFKGQYKNWKEIKFDHLRIFTVKFNNGEIWTNFYGVMMAKGNFTGKDILVPIHRTMLWQNDKVVKDVHVYDTKLIMEELAARAAAGK